MTKLFDWCNDASKDFLYKGYLVEGETIEQRAADIAKAVGIYYTKASGFQLSGSQIEKKVYDYIGRGFYSLSSPFLSNAFRDRVLPISCRKHWYLDFLQSEESRTVFPKIQNCLFRCHFQQ